MTMLYHPGRRSAAHYHKTRIQTQVSEADPHQLIALLLDGACRRIRLAQAGLQHGDMARKGKAIGDACAILGYLADVLDRQAGGKVAANLGGLYAYVMQRLTEANASNDGQWLAEALELVDTISAAWAAIPARQRSLPARH